jgi:hypothetical protein
MEIKIIAMSNHVEKIKIVHLLNLRIFKYLGLKKISMMIITLI